MKKSVEAVKYMISVWDEVTGKTWRENPDHVQKIFLEAEAELLHEHQVDKSFSATAYSNASQDNDPYVHWTEGTRVIITKGGLSMDLSGHEVHQLIKALPRTVSGIH